MEQKQCVLCSAVYPKPAWISKTNWELRKYCSRKCLDNSKFGNTYRRGKKHPNIWNKGKKNPYTQKTLLKMSKSMRKVALEKGFGKWMAGKKASIETRKKLSETMKKRVADGKHNFYIDGRTPEVKRIRTSLEYKLWRESVYKRDNYTCQECGARSGKGKKVVLNADHIKPFALHPELRFDINNGRTLCIDCHKKTDTYLGKIFKKV